MAPTVERVAAAAEQRGLLKLVEETDDVGGVEAKRLGERHLSDRAAVAKDREHDEVPRSQPGRLERGLGASPCDPREVMREQRAQPDGRSPRGGDTEPRGCREVTCGLGLIPGARHRPTPSVDRYCNPTSS
jgi:hypothetical protein